MGRSLSGQTLVAGVVGRPVRHSLSPHIHSAWIEAAGIDAAYAPFAIAEDGFQRFVEGMRGGAVRGVNVTLPYKEDALALAEESDPMSRRAGAANLLLFHSDGRIEARNTDGPGMMHALQGAPGFHAEAGPAVVLGAGGAARAAAAALVAAGVPALRLVNRTRARAARLAETFPDTSPHGWDEMAEAFEGAAVVINATSAGLNGENALAGLPLAALPSGAVVMDMVYKPLTTALLREAKARGLAVVDGLSMLIGQAIPSFEAFYGVAAPAEVDVRRLCLAALEAPE